MPQQRVAKDKVVYMTYVVNDDQGTELERCDLPVGYVHGGHGRLLAKVEQALEGCPVGERIAVTLMPQEAFGEHRPELVYVDDIDNVPPQYRRIGAEAEFVNDRGDTKVFVVTHIEDGKLTLDGNHPYAGKTVTFALTITEVRDATLEEIASGEAGAPVSSDMH